MDWRKPPALAAHTFNIFATNYEGWRPVAPDWPSRPTTVMSMVASVLAVSQATVALVAGLGGALIGGAATFAGTWWERRTERRQARYEDVRTVLRSINASAQDVLTQYVVLADENDKRALIEAQARLGTATADLGLYSINDEGLPQTVDVLFRLGAKLVASSSGDAGLAKAFNTAYTNYVVSARSHLDRLAG